MGRLPSLAALLLAVGLAACGGSRDDGAAATTPAPVPTTTDLAVATTPAEPDLPPAVARQRRRVAEIQRVVAGRFEPAGRPAAVAAVASAVTRDARARQRAGELRRRPRVTRTACEPLADGRAAARSAPPGVLLLECTAVTSETKSRYMKGTVMLGFEFHARVESARGRYAFCAVEVPPAEGGSNFSAAVPVSSRCGG